jgi:uncharacterized RDD family membrane protein YckC
VQPASVGRRALGGFIDLIPMGIVFVILAKAGGTYTHGDGQLNVRVNNGYFLLFLLAIVVYHFAFEAAFGKTPGKMIVGTRVVDENGGKASIGQLLGRNAMRLIDIIGFYLVGFVAVIASERNARLGDIAAKTAVVRD